jgi:hypothetical protein
MTGDFFQRIYSMPPVPFTLKRTGGARVEAPVKNAPVSQQIEGTWNGTLAALEPALSADFARDGVGGASIGVVDGDTVAATCGTRCAIISLPSTAFRRPDAGAACERSFINGHAQG